MPHFSKVLTTKTPVAEDNDSTFPRQVERRLGKGLRARQFRPTRERDAVKRRANAKRQDARIKILGSNTDSVAYV